MNLSTILIVALAVVAALVLAPRFMHRGPAQAASGSNPKGVFVFVKIPDPVDPLARADRYERPLDAALQAASRGRVTGGGTQLGTPNADGRSAIEWVGLDVELDDLEHGLQLLKAALRRIGAPAGTVLEYRQDGVLQAEPIG